MWPSTGSFTAGASVAADTTGRALEEFFAELNRIRAGDISTAEAAKARETFRNDTVRDFSSLSGMLDAIGERLDAGLDFELFSRDLGMIGRIDEKELNETANTAIQMNHAVLVLVGDKATILEQIKGQRLPDPEFYSLDGEPVR
jgi:predicted Zn-dependent peptidase